MHTVAAGLREKEAIRMARQCDDPLLAQLMAMNETVSNLSLDNERLRAEVDRLNEVVEELREKLDRSEVNLQPCPFCGNTDITLSYVDPEDTCRLFCTKCGTEVDFGVSKAEAVKLWNTRAATPKCVDTDDEYP